MAARKPKRTVKQPAKPKGRPRLIPKHETGVQVWSYFTRENVARIDAEGAKIGFGRAAFVRKIVLDYLAGNAEKLAPDVLAMLDEQAKVAGLTPGAYVRKIVTGYVTDVHDMEIYDKHADEINAEVLDSLEYQADVFEAHETR